MRCRAIRWGVAAPTVAFFLAMTMAACSTTEPTTRPSDTPDRPAGPVTRSVDGFRIQIGMSTEQAEADDVVEAAANWYLGLPSSERHPYLGSSDIDVQVVWRAPYYRVQVGRFATRAEAEGALPVVARRFPDAFPVPARVTVTR